MVYFACNCSNVTIATENVYGPLTNSELKSRPDLPIYTRNGDPSADTYSPFGSAKNILEATLGIGGIKIEHKYLTQREKINSLEVIKCFICSTVTHAAKSPDSVKVFINDKLRRVSPSLEVPETLCPLKISLSNAVQPNGAYLGKSVTQLYRLMAANNQKQDKAAAIDELLTRTARYNEEAQRVMEDEIRVFIEKAHEKYNAKQSAINSCMNVLAQLIASMDSPNDDGSNDQRAQENSNSSSRPHDGNSVESAGKVSEDDSRNNIQVDSKMSDLRSSVPPQLQMAQANGSVNGLSEESVETVEDTFGDMEFNGDDAYGVLVSNEDSGSSNASEANDEDATESESEDMTNDPLINANRPSQSNDIALMPNRRGSSSTAINGRSGSFSATYSRSVPIDVPPPSFDRRNSRLLEESNETLENIDEDYYTKIARDAKTVVADGTEILGQLPSPNPRSLAKQTS